MPKQLGGGGNVSSRVVMNPHLNTYLKITNPVKLREKYTGSSTNENQPAP